MKHCSMTTLIVAVIVALAIGVYAGKNMNEEYACLASGNPGAASNGWNCCSKAATRYVSGKDRKGYNIYAYKCN
jgi:hypothetical protein